MLEVYYTTVPAPLPFPYGGATRRNDLERQEDKSGITAFPL